MTLRLALLFVLPCLAGYAQVAALHSGDVLPDVAGQTLAGKQLHLPADGLGKPAVVVFSFSHAAADDANKWDATVQKEFGSGGGVENFTIIMLEDAPRLLRGMISSRIKNGEPPAVRDRMAIVVHDEAAWKKRFSVADTHHSYVALLDREGRIRWVGSAAYSDTAVSSLKEEMAPLLQHQ